MATAAVLGIHHVTAIASDPQRNLDFYTGLLGLSLVKLTINFDDPGTYHLYFGNQAGAPGSILTFFPWPGARRGAIGNGQVSATAFAVHAEALDYWRDRLAGHGVIAADGGRRFDEPVLRFSDPDGMPLELIGVAGAEPGHAIGGLHSATLSEEGYERTAALLQDTMGLRLVGNESNRYRYAAADGTPGAIVDVVCSPDGRAGRSGAGTVHHIAWRVTDDAAQAEWRTRLVTAGYNVSPVMDRTYFHSIYYREPGGILFEMATDPPGFAADEPGDHLGERLMLPPWLEPHRTAVEAGLPPLTLPPARQGRP
ncbi:MAG: ring-cleaving dioxygenase [Vicinamibacterales bacterium]